MIRRRLCFSLFFVGASFLSFPSFTQDTPATTSKETVAIVSGQALHEEDLKPLIQGQLQQLQQQEYQLKRQALDELINQKLIEIEAKKKGLTTEELLTQEIDAKLPEPNDSEIKGFYLALQEQLNRPLEEIKPQLRQELKQAKVQQARQEYMDQLREQARVVVHLTPPKMMISYDPARVKGNSNAPVTIVEFSDFQCPFCKRVTPTLEKLLTQYEGKVRLAYRDFPLSQIHPQAQKAAEASRCAGEQGKFWEYHDLLFADQDTLDFQSLLKKANNLKLNEQKFEECLASGKYTAAVEKDLEAGEQAGVSGTPAFFINGIFLSGAVPLESFTRLIDEELVRVQEEEQATEK